MFHLFRHYRKNREGGMTVELAIILPTFLMMVVGIMETGMLFFTSSSLENAVLHTSRFGILGNDGDDGTTREDQILSIIEEQTFGRVNMGDLKLDTLVYNNFSDINTEEPYDDANDDGEYTDGESYSDVNGNGQWDADMGIQGLGGAGDIVLYKITYTYKSLTGFMDPIFENIDMTATVAVRNEPF
ncbi:pilus assembly protein [Temperatibacter marinus]|uniref:Pilus assembly protein n=1 Tax=Temperatibacter marinus TaxID=1456591 RepID=A0AA52EHZ5_9PROT|nr:pilus assembly protein [Temperatibacter marinus]WND02654.1 pilus assembly protein [Temperatibacter marinus]